MPTVRQKVERALRVREVDERSPLHAVPGIGPYLSARAARALRVEGRTATLRDLWTGTRDRVQARDFVRRIVQNERANQCVATRVASTTRRTYHTGDVNQHGYEAFATLLNYAAPHPRQYRARDPTVPPSAAFRRIPTVRVHVPP